MRSTPKTAWTELNPVKRHQMVLEEMRQHTPLITMLEAIEIVKAHVLAGERLTDSTGLIQIPDTEGESSSQANWYQGEHPEFDESDQIG